MEYIEPGASAVDGRRPAFQQMIQDAVAEPRPFEAIIIHSLSRFFRDTIEFGLYERKLNKHGIKVISITQQTGDDPAGEMARKIFNVFDEYQSRENAKHTLRAMKENARRGFFNGSAPPYGYRTVEVEVKGRRGKKRRIEIDEAESAIVQKIFDLYEEGRKPNGELMGLKGIAYHLNDIGITRRGRAWSKTTVSEILNNTAYIGEYYFNKRECKTQRMKPRKEWVKIDLPKLIEEDAFYRIKALRENRSPEVTPPRVVSSPTLLTGLLKCGYCSSAMTLATGKGGRYRYYKCTARINRGKKPVKREISGWNISMNWFWTPWWNGSSLLDGSPN